MFGFLVGFLVKVCFYPPAGACSVKSTGGKKCLNGTDINRLTEQKTGGDVNKNKLVTEKKREWIEKRQRGEKETKDHYPRGLKEELCTEDMNVSSHFVNN